MGMLLRFVVEGFAKTMTEMFAMIHKGYFGMVENGQVTAVGGSDNVL